MLRRSAAVVAVALLGTCGAAAGVAVASKATSGHISGTEVLNAAITVKVTGPVTVKRVGDRTWHKTVHAKEGHFVATVPAGRYVLTGKDGNAQCFPAKVTLHAHQTTHVTVTCSGM